MGLDTNEQAQLQRALAEELILGLNAAIRVVRYHSADNDASLSALNKLQGTLAKLFDHHFDVSVLFYAHDFYVNEVRVKPNASNFELFEGLADQLAERGVGSIDFHVVPTRDDIACVVTAMFGPDGSAETPKYAEIVDCLQAQEVTSIGLQPYIEAIPQDLPEIDKGEFVRQAYFRAIPLMQQLFVQASARRPLALKKATRVVQNFVDVLTDDNREHSDMLILLTRVKNYHGYLPNHAVNTSILSVAFGQAIGLGRNALRKLGLAAILADIGNAALPESTLQQSRSLHPGQIRAVRSHPIRGVALVTGYQQLSDLVVAAAMGCAEHHRGAKGGYPQALRAPVGINAAIIAVCDRFDAMTTARPHRKEALPAAEALDELAREVGDGLDAAVVNAFCWWISSLSDGGVVHKENGDLEVRVRPPDRQLRRAAERLRTELSPR